VVSTLFELISKIVARYRILVAISRRAIQISDNDSNVNMNTNGERHLLCSIMRCLTVDSRVIDVGCNVGEWSYLLRELGYKGSTLMVDLDADAISKAVLKNSEYKMSTEYVCSAITSGTEFETTFYKGMHSEHNSIYDMTAIGNFETKTQRSVPSITLDWLVEQRKINHVAFLKLDIEGGEFDALKGASSLLKRQLIDFVQFEYGLASMAAKVFLTDIVKLLQQFDYTTFKVMPNSLKKVEMSTLLNSAYSCSNFLAVSPGAHSHLQENTLD